MSKDWVQDINNMHEKYGVRPVVEKMTTYAIGRSLSFSDNADIDNIVVQFRKQEDRLGDLILIIAQSEIFNSK